MKRFSIIIPHRGDVSLLERAIASVPVRDDIQLLVEEDTDGCGAGYARNRALGKASGEWLLFLDSDDYFTPDVLLEIEEGPRVKGVFPHPGEIF